jgi:apolipoprotein N-acyltransferase
VKRFAIALGATLLSGVGYALAFPPLRLRALAFVALVPFLLALRSVGPRAALLLCWLLSIFTSYLVADALPAAVETYFLQPPLLSHGFAIGVWTVTVAIYTMLFGPVYRAIVARPSVWTPLLAGAAWAGCELLRGRLFTGSSFFVGNPWALLGYSQAGAEWLAQVASLGGPYLISFVVAAANAAVVELVVAWRRDRVARRRALRAAALGAAPLGLALLYGAIALRGAGDEAAPAVEVAIVQGDVELGSVWRSDFYGRNLEIYLRGTQEAASGAQPRVAFWPEAALTFFLADEPDYQRAIARVLGAQDLELVVGGPSRAQGDGERFYNSVFLVGPDGAIRARYDKQYLVPFSEFFPLAGLDLLRRRFERVRVFEHGPDDAVLLPTRAGRAGVLTCNEAMLPEVAGRRVAAGAEILVSPSNDSWIRADAWAEQMFDMVALRAIEQRRYLVRASTSGPSAIVDPWGRVIARTQPFSRDVALGAVRPRTQRSLYGVVGDAFGFACVAVVPLVLLLRRARGAAA